MRRRVALIASASTLLLALIGAGVASAYYHPSPTGARTASFGLVPTYVSWASPCGTGQTSKSHGAPLTFPSCSPPVPRATRVVVGTAAGVSNGAGLITLKVYCTNTNNGADNGLIPPCTASGIEDVKITSSSSDIRCKTNTAVTGHCPADTGAPQTLCCNDYNGQLVGASTIRITDSYNGPSGTTTGGTTAATVNDIPFSVGVQCVGTPTVHTTGGTCNISTSANAVLPNSGGTVKKGKKAIVEIGQVSIADTGASGVGVHNPLSSAPCPPACLKTGQDSFVQGIYIP